MMTATAALTTWEHNGLTFQARPESTDLKALDEVVRRRVYLRRDGFTIEPGETWLDLGGNIGSFTVLAASMGATVITYEPEPSNMALLRMNLDQNWVNAETHQAAVIAGDEPTVDFYVCTSPLNHYRHTTKPTRGRQKITVPAVSFADACAPDVTGIKMDIEGAEIGILDATNDWSPVQKLTFEYHFGADREIAHFHRRMDRLREWFPNLHHPKMAESGRWEFFPDAVIVHAWK